MQIAIEFYGNKYGGLKTDNKTPDWPPSLSRLLQAVLAGAYYTHDLSEIENAREVIKYLSDLSAQQPPEIYAPTTVHGHKDQEYGHGGFIQYVPRNIIPELDRETGNLSFGRFCNPSQLLDGSTVTYVWNVADPPLTTIARAFDNLHAFGRGEDFAFARVEQDGVSPKGQHYVPAKGGTVFVDVPVAGFLADLDVVYQTKKRSELLHFRTEAYSLKERVHALRQHALSELQQIDSEKFYAYPTTDAAIVAAQVRHAVLELLKREDLSEKNLTDISGHGDPKLKLQFLPLASDVAHEHATGIRRVAVVGPPSLSKVIEMIRESGPGRVLTDTTGQEICRLAERKRSDDGRAVFEQYLGAGTEFESVTPVVWYRGATKNHKVNQSRLERVAKEIFTDAELPTPITVSVSQPREQFFAPAHLRRLPAFHLRVRFAEEVKGIVTAGLGAASGLGIFANLARP